MRQHARPCKDCEKFKLTFSTACASAWLLPPLTSAQKQVLYCAAQTSGQAEQTVVCRQMQAPLWLEHMRVDCPWVKQEDGADARKRSLAHAHSQEC